MNIILNRTVNGYELPWWCSIISAINPCSQNSVYATNEMDDAQLDRFLKITVKPSLDEWVNYAIEKGLHEDIIKAVAANEEIFYGSKQKGYDDESELSPTARSLEMVSIIYSNIKEVMNTKFFTPEERQKMNSYLRTLINGKIGGTAGRELLRAIDDHNNVKADEIITGKSATIAEDVISRFNTHTVLGKKVVADRLLKYMAAKFTEFEKKSKEPKNADIIKNVLSQFKQFIDILPDSIRLVFLKQLAEFDKLKCEDGKALYYKVASVVATDALVEIAAFKQNVKNVGEA
jgi:hypothetical protein